MTDKKDIEADDTDSFLHHNVFDLFSLKKRVIVITGGARGIGLSMAFAVAEAGADVAIIDSSPEPHQHYHLLAKRHGIKTGFYQ